MGKDPAFLFYPGDWLGGTIGMTLEEKGAYMELLMAQFSRGHMTEHMIERMVGQNWVTLKDKFQKDAEGNFFNARLEIEIEKRKAYVGSRRNNIKGTNQHTKNKGYMNGHMTPHMENENENRNDNVNKVSFTISKNSFLLNNITDQLFISMFTDCVNGRGILGNIAAFKQEYAHLIGNNQQIQKQVMSKTGWDKHRLVEATKEFVLTQEAVHKEYSSPAEYFTHFLNWAKKNK